MLKARIVEPGPGHVDQDGSHYAADAHLDLDSISSDGDSIAVLHIGLTKGEPEIASVEAAGIELTRGDIETLIVGLQALLATSRS